MNQRYEYKFVRLGEGRFGVRRQAGRLYQQTVEQHGAQGWRLVQIFCPGTGMYGAARFYECIFERPIE